MNLEPFEAAYICGLKSFNWQDVLWGVQQGLVRSIDVVPFAMCRLTEDSDDAEFALAAADPRDEAKVDALLSRVAVDVGDVSVSNRKWLFLTLLRAAERLQEPQALFAHLNDIFCEFEHPEVMFPFIPWMPPQEGYDPTRYSYQENITRIVRRLYDYLEREGSRLGIPVKLPAR